MAWGTAVAMYFVIWWITLFAVLPIGTKPVVTPDSQSGWRGAPERPGLLRKALINTVVAGVVWAILYLTIVNGWLSFRSGWLAMPVN